MKALFTSGDVGGARALLPVLAACRARGLSALALEHGHLPVELGDDGETITPERLTEGMAELLHQLDVRVVVFASSVKDTLALTLARNAAEQGIPTMHMLDNWTGYRLRMEMDGLPQFTPDVYAVMDEPARQGALAEGVAPGSLVVTGQPALASLREECGMDRPGFARDPKEKWIVFVSEPVESDQGANPDSPNYRGYTEKTVLRTFCAAMQPFAHEVRIGVLPHPRENANGLMKIWEEARGDLEGKFLFLDKGRDCLASADGLAGMASILLYEAWLLGKPVASLQPGLRLEPYRSFQEREGLLFGDTEESTARAVRELASQVRTGREPSPRPELSLHEAAPDRVVKIIENLMARFSHERGGMGSDTQ